MTIAIVAWLGSAIAVPVFFQQPPTPIPTDGDAKSFSAFRASVILQQLVGDGIPHPAGSPQNDVVRERIESLFSDFGYTTEVQSARHLPGRKPITEDTPESKTVPLENIMARLPGKTPGQAVLLTAHYDSVAEGPGASDDGVGMSAVLEIARMLKSEGPFEHDIIFLLTDGEELGLLGADKFIDLHPWADEVECVVNLEARGTYGPSFMFETSEHSRWLIPMFARSVQRPMTSSLFYEVYKRMPRDTDFTLYKRGGFQGYNFAFIGNRNAYHTADDNFENVHLGTLQHHGDNMLGLARTLANLDFSEQPEGRIVYFDLLGWIVVYWPSNWSIGLGILGVGLILLTGRSAKNESNSQGIRLLPSHLASGLFLVIVTSMLIATIGFLLSTALAFDGAFDQPWPRFPWPVPMAFFLVAITVSTVTVWFANTRVKPNAIWSATWLIWGALTVLVSWSVDGASHLFIIPLITAGLGGLLFQKNRSILWPATLGAISSGFMWLSLEAQFHEALGFQSLGVNLITLRTTLVVLTLLPVIACGERKELARLIGLLGLATIVTLASRLFF